MTALNTVGAVSILRIHERLSSIFDIPISTGTLKNIVIRCADSLIGTHEKIRQHMTTLALLYCDEAGTCTEGKTWWIHNASDRDFTYLTIYRKRGQADMDAARVLPGF